MSDAITVRELLLTLGFEADLGPLVAYGRAAEALTVTLEGTAEEANASAASVAGLSQRFQAAAPHLKAAREAAAEFGIGLFTLAKYAAGAAVAINGFFAGLAANAGLVANDALEIERQAGAMGMTVEAYQELRGVFQGFGVDASNMADAMNTISDRALTAATDGGDAAVQFKLLGISVQQLKGKKPEEILDALADGFRSAGDATQWMAAASRIFGDDLSRKVIPMLQGGSAGIAKYKDGIRRLGGVLDKEAIAKGADLSRSMMRVSGQADALRKRLGSALVPAVGRLVAGVADWIDANAELIRSGIDVWGERLGMAFDLAREGALAIADAVKHLVAHKAELAAVALSVGAIAAGFAVFELGGPVLAGLTALGEGLAFALGLFGVAGIPVLALGFGALQVVVLPLAALFAAFAAAVVLAALGIDDLITYMEGGDSLIGDFIKSFAGNDTILGLFADNLGAWIEVLRALISVLVPFGNIFRLIFGAAMQYAADQVALVGKGLAALLGLDTSGLSGWSEGLLSLARGLKDVASWLDRVIGKAGSFTDIARNLAGSVAGFAAPSLSNAASFAGSLVPSLPSLAGGGAVNNNQRSATVGGAVLNIYAGTGDPAEIGAVAVRGIAEQLRGAQSLLLGD
jgi:hypothetical protein